MANRCLEPIASYDGSVIAMTADETNVYWTGSTKPHEFSVMKVSSLGGSPITLASSPEFAGAIAVDATSVYWISGGSAVLKVPRGGGASMTVASWVAHVSDRIEPSLAVDGQSVYWTTNDVPGLAGPGMVASAPVTGGATKTLVSLSGGGASALAAIAVRQGTVYWADEYQGVMSITTSGDARATLALSTGSFGSPEGIAVDAKSVFFAADNGVARVPIRGGTPEMVSNYQYGIEAIVIDDRSVYWSNMNGVLGMPLEGGAITTLGKAVAESNVLAVDATSLYWPGWPAGDAVSAGMSSGQFIMKLTPK